MRNRTNRKSGAPVFIFDIGGVVIFWPNNDPIIRRIANLYNIKFAELKSIMSCTFPELESGRIEPGEFISDSLLPFHKEINVGDNPETLIAAPFASVAKARKSMIELIQNLRSKGFIVRAFSNTNFAHLKIMEEKGWKSSLFDYFFASCSLGVLKPKLVAYQKVIKKLGVSRANIIFIDNALANVVGAKKAGIRYSFRYHSTFAIKKEIRKILQEYGK